MTPQSVTSHVLPYSATLKLSTGLIKKPEEREKSTCIFSSKDNPHILSAPVQFACGDRACTTCVTEKLLAKPDLCCPKNETDPNADCAQKVTLKTVFYDKSSERDINGLIVHCKNYSSDGCEWTGELRHLKEHHIAQCPAEKNYLEKENAYLWEKLANITQEQNSSPNANNEIKQLHEIIETQQKQISLDERTITKLKQDKQELESSYDQLIKDCMSFQKEYTALQGECLSLQDKNSSLESECSSFKTAYDLLLADIAEENPNTGNTQTRPEAATPGPSAIATTRSATRNVTPRTIQPEQRQSATPSANVFNWSFDYITAPKNADSRIESEIFSVGHYTYKLLFEYYMGRHASVYLQVMGGDADAVWPCQESLTISLKIYHGPGQDISKTLHLANTPIPCRNQPDNSPNAANAAVGFTDFCTSGHLSIPEPWMEQNHYLNDKNEITLSVSSVTEPSQDLISPVYDVASGSVGLYWPIREYSRKTKAYNSYNPNALSPQFYTSGDGCCLKLKLNTQNGPESNGIYTGIQAVLQQGKNDRNFQWPLKGRLSITLVDRNPLRREKEDRTIELPIEFTKPTKTNCDEGFASNTSDKMRFYPRVFIPNEAVTDPSKSIYIHDNTVLITATFVPEEK